MQPVLPNSLVPATLVLCAPAESRTEMIPRPREAEGALPSPGRAPMFGEQDDGSARATAQRDGLYMRLDCTGMCQRCDRDEREGPDPVRRGEGKSRRPPLLPFAIPTTYSRLSLPPAASTLPPLSLLTYRQAAPPRSTTPPTPSLNLSYAPRTNNKGNTLLSRLGPSPSVAD